MILAQTLAISAQHIHACTNKFTLSALSENHSLLTKYKRNLSNSGGRSSHYRNFEELDGKKQREKYHHADGVGAHGGGVHMGELVERPDGYDKEGQDGKGHEEGHEAGDALATAEVEFLGGGFGATSLLIYKRVSGELKRA
ncbi:MAG: hypothetical protein Q9194_003064 [Teloschistes cf. exilis]